MTIDEAENYMRLLQGKSAEIQRLDIWNKRRSMPLDEIHFREMQLDRLDYLRHIIQIAGGSRE